jgi:hypothetical protein
MMSGRSRDTESAVVDRSNLFKWSSQSDCLHRVVWCCCFSWVNVFSVVFW